VRVSDVNRGNRNIDEVPITIAAASPTPPTASPPGSGSTTTPHTGLYPEHVPGEIAPPPPLPVAP
jgi:hypothetical protein